jgi:bacterioferritin-associated ferredoxin
VYVCLCKGLTESDVKRQARSASFTVDALMVDLGLQDDDCCGRCANDAEEFAAIAATEWIPLHAGAA